MGTKPSYQFGSFRLDARQKLLFRDGQPVPLTPKAIETLLVLVECGGELVTKDNLLQRVWPDVTVEEGNLAFHISLIRKALSDDRHNGNRFIETIPKRGYRFVAPILDNLTPSGVVPREAEAEESPAVPQVITRTRSPRFWIVSLIGIAFPLAAIIFGIELFNPEWGPRIVSLTPLTSDRRNKTGIFTSGGRVYFSEQIGKFSKLVSVPSRGGQEVPFAMALPDATIIGISPDQSIILFERADHTLWIVTPPSGLPRQVGNLFAVNARLSPDASQIAYVGLPDEHEIYIVNLDGHFPRKLATLPGDIQGIRWSPDGRWLRFSVIERHGDIVPESIWEVSVSGKSLGPVLNGWHNPATECCGDWTSDGKYYVFGSTGGTSGARSDLWAIREETGVLRRQSRPMLLTSGPIDFFAFAPSPDRSRLFALGTERRGELSVFDEKRGELVPYLGGIAADWVTFSRDGRWLAYIDFATKTLWRMRTDGKELRQLTFEPLIVDGFSIAPDGNRIAFRGLSYGSASKIYVIPSTGGKPEILIQNLDQDQGIPTWSSDGTYLVFGDIPKKKGFDDGSHAIHRYDLEKHETSDLPGSRGLWTARWSPDGRQVCALTISDTSPKPQSLMLYDVRTQQWKGIGLDHVSDPIWSHDSRFIYFAQYNDLGQWWLARVSVADGRLEKMADLNGTSTALRVPGWIGLTPRDEPMMLRSIGATEVYSLEVHWP